MSDAVSAPQETQYIDWSGVVPIIVAGLRSNDADVAGLMIEVYRMAGLADLANQFLPKFYAQGDILSEGTPQLGRSPQSVRGRLQGARQAHQAHGADAERC
jgi:hypothetical protein